MKKVLTLLLATLVLLGLFVGCSLFDSEDKGIDRVGTILLDDGSRSLSSEILPPSATDLFWTYTAVRSDGKYGFIGRHIEPWFMSNAGKETNSDEPQKGIPTSLGQFSYGDWTFEFKAYDCATTPTDIASLTDLTPVYVGKTENFTVGSSTQKLTMVVDLNTSSTGKGTVLLDSVFELTLENDQDVINMFGSTTATQTDLLVNLVLTTESGDKELFNGQKAVTRENYKVEVPFTKSFELAAGTQTLKFVLYVDGIKTSCEYVPVSVYAGMTTKINGTFEENVSGETTIVPSEVKVPTIKIEKVVANKVEVPQTFTEDAGKKTTVEFADGIVGAGEDAQLTMKMLPADNVSFAVSAGNDKAPIAGFDLTLLVGQEKKSDFGAGKYVTITTYIAKNLTNVEVKYNGDGADPILESYVPATGELVFKTNHFSEFYVVADSEAYIEETGKYYPTFVEAIADAEGQTVKLIKNVALDAGIDIVKDKIVTIDLNGHSITKASENFNCADYDYLFVVCHGGNLTVTDTSVGETGSIDATGLCVAIKMTKANDGSQEVAVLTVEAGTIKGSEYGISGNGNSGRGNTDVTINGGTIKAVGDNAETAIYNPQQGLLTINGGTIEGPNGVYVKSGSVVTSIKAGTIKTTTAATSYTFNGNGVSAKGYALVVDNAGYVGGKPNATIKGGNFEGKVESFAASGKDKILNFIYGGTFTDEPAANLIAEGYAFEGGEVVYDPVAVIGSKGYSSLVNAVAAAKTGDTVKLLKDSEGTGIFVGAGNKKFTINLNGKTYTLSSGPVGSTGTENQSFHLEKGNTITIKNGTITSDESVKASMHILVQNYCNLTLDNVKLDGTNLRNNGDYVLSNNCGNVNLTGNTKIIANAKDFALDSCKFSSYEPPVVTVEDATINGRIEVTGGTLNIKGGSFAFNGSDSIILKSGTLNISGGSFNFAHWGIDVCGGELNISGGTFEAQEACVTLKGNANSETEISGGVFTSNDNFVIGNQGSPENKDHRTDLTISGGEFNGKISTLGYMACGIYWCNTGVLTVNGGKFEIEEGSVLALRAGTLAAFTIDDASTYTSSERTEGGVGDKNYKLPAGHRIVVDKTNPLYPAGLPVYTGVTITDGVNGDVILTDPV